MQLERYSYRPASAVMTAERQNVATARRIRPTENSFSNLPVFDPLSQTSNPNLATPFWSREERIERTATMSEVPPTRMNQQIFKVKKKAAEGGYKLLKKKADALKVRFLEKNLA